MRSSSNWRRVDATAVLLVLVLGSGPASGSEHRPFAPLRLADGDPTPSLDGRLDEPLWSRAPAIRDFLQRSPTEGAAPRESTVVRMAYTSTDLFVAFRCYDSRPDAIVATVRRRDDFALVQNDQVVLSIDSYSDSRNGFFFSTNPLGVRVDAQFFDEGERFVDAWDGAWDVATARDALGWTAEFRIPFSALQFERAESNEMGINLFRRVIRTNEELFSPLIPLSFAAGTPSVSAARKIVLHSIDGGHGLRLEPRVVGGYERPADGRGHATDTVWGGDLRWRITPSLAARVSAKTDFAQIEADDRQINLTQYALFVPEKRDFFLENSGLYSVGAPSEVELFFSRRIGLETLPDGTIGEVPIRVGTKVSGRLAGLETGLLHMNTEATPTHPAEHFFVARLKRQATRRSYVGAVATRRRGASGVSGRNTFGVDGLVRLPRDVSATALAAVTTDESGRAESSGAGRIRIERSGERQTFHLEWLELQSRFDPAVGLVLRPATRSWRGGLQWPFYWKSGSIRRVTPGHEYRRFDGLSGRTQDAEHRFSLGTEFRSGDTIDTFATRRFELVEREFSLLGRVPVPAATYSGWTAGLELRTKAGRRLSGTVRVEEGELYAGRQRTLAGSLLWKVNAHLTASQDVEVSRVHQPGSVFSTRILQTRADYSLDVATSLSAFLQYDNVTDELGARLQGRYILLEGTELLAVYTAAWDRSGAGSALRQQTIRLKATYGFDL